MDSGKERNLSSDVRRQYQPRASMGWGAYCCDDVAAALCEVFVFPEPGSEATARDHGNRGWEEGSQEAIRRYESARSGVVSTVCQWLSRILDSPYVLD